MFIYTIMDVITLVLIAVFALAMLGAWVYQKYWFLPRHTLNHHTNKWERNKK